MEVEDKITKQYDTDHKGHAFRVLQNSVKPLETCVSTISSDMYQYSLFRHVSIHTNTLLSISEKTPDPQYKVWVDLHISQSF